MQTAVLLALRLRPQRCTCSASSSCVLRAQTRPAAARSPKMYPYSSVLIACYFFCIRAAKFTAPRRRKAMLRPNRSVLKTLACVATRCEPALVSLPHHSVALGPHGDRSHLHLSSVLNHFSSTCDRSAGLPFAVLGHRWSSGVRHLTPFPHDMT